MLGHWNKTPYFGKALWVDVHVEDTGVMSGTRDDGAPWIADERFSKGLAALACWHCVGSALSAGHEVCLILDSARPAEHLPMRPSCLARKCRRQDEKRTA